MHFPPRLGRRFWQMWAASGLSSVGDGMVYVGFPLLALHFTSSTVLIAGVAVVGQVPALLIALPAGALADRIGRRRLLVGLELLAFADLAAFSSLVLAGRASLVSLYVTTFVLGASRFGYRAASSAALTDVVPDDLLVKANSRLTAANYGGDDVAGQAVGGFAFSLARSLPFAADALSFLASALLLRRAIPDRDPNPSPLKPATFLADLRAGTRWFLRNRLLRLLAGLISAFAFCQALVFALLVLYATRDLHVSRGGYGLMLGIAAVASVLGTAAAPHLHDRLGAGTCIVLAGVATAAAYAVLASTGSPVAATAALALERVGLMVGMIASVSLRQTTTPADLQGRVASAHQTVVFGVVPLGSLAGGLLAAAVGIRPSFYVAAAVQAAVVALAAPRLVARIREVMAERAATPPPLSVDLVGVDGKQGVRKVAGLTVDGVLELPGTGDRAHEGGVETGDGRGAVAERP